jgi:hypothetical protein
MASTDIATTDPGGYLALTRTADEIQEIVADNLAGQDITEFDLRRVGMPAGGATVWQVPTLAGLQNLEELSGILVYTKQTRSYWSNDQDTGEPPLCSSPDSIVGVGTPGGDCRSCPLSQFGSKINEKTGQPDKGQACTQRAMWFLLREEGFLPIVVSLSPTSLRAAKQYMLDLAGAGIRFNEVVTTIRLEQDRNAGGDKYSRAVPTLGARLDPETAQAARAYADILKPIFEQAAAAAATEAQATPAAA